MVPMNAFAGVFGHAWLVAIYGEWAHLGANWMLPNAPKSLQQQNNQQSGAARARVPAKSNCTTSRSTPNGATTTKPG